MYKSVILDLGLTIVPIDFSRGYAALAGRCALPDAEVRRRIAESGLVEPFETGQIEPEVFASQFSAVLDMDVDYSTFCGLWSTIFTPGSLIPEEMVEGLAARYRLVLLSNTNAIHFEMIQNNYPILRHFHAFVLSYRVGAMKPDPRIYRAAIAEAGCPPEECFFADDVASYVQGARAAGIDAVQFRSAEQLETDLAARGIAWR